MKPSQHTQQARKLSKKKIILISLASVLAVLLSIVAYASFRPTTDAQQGAYPFNKVENLNSAVTYLVMNGSRLEKKNTSNDKTSILYEGNDLADFTQLPDKQVIVLTYGGVLWKVSPDGAVKEEITTVPGDVFSSLQTVDDDTVGLLVDMPEDAIVETDSEFAGESEHSGHDDIGYTQTLKFVDVNTGDSHDLTSDQGNPYGVTEWLMDENSAHFVFRVGEGSDVGLMNMGGDFTNLGPFINMGGFIEEENTTWFWGRGEDTSVSAVMVKVANPGTTRPVPSSTPGSVSDVITSMTSTPDGIITKAVSTFPANSEPGSHLITHEDSAFEMTAATHVESVTDLQPSLDGHALIAQLTVNHEPTVIFLNTDSLKPGHNPVRGEKVMITS